MKNMKFVMALALTMLVSVVFAQPGITVGTDSGQVGTNVTIPVNYLGTGSAVVGFQADINYDNTVLSVSSMGCEATLNTAGATTVNIACADNGSRVRVLVNPNATLDEIASGLLANIVFTIDGGAPVPSTSNITLSGEAYGNNIGGAVAETGSLDGSVMVVSGPSPTYTSAPATASTLTFATVLQGGTADTQSIDITNTGDPMSTLTGTCAVTGADMGSYTINSGGAYSVAEGAAANTVVVECSTAAAGTFNAAALECTSMAGGNGTYPLECTVATPGPAYDSTPAPNSAIAFGSALAGSGDLTQSVTITNIGDVGTDLNTICTIVGGDAARFSVDVSLTAAITQGGAGAIGDVTCLDGVAGALASTLSCTHDGTAVGAASPVEYALSCEFTPPGQAQYASTPADNAIIEMTMGTGILVGSAPPTTSIAITNSAPGAADNDLGLEACTYAGDAAISVTSADPLSTSLAPVGAATETVAFSCDTAVAGNFSGTYSCPFSTDAVAGSEGTATYTVNCDVRATESAGNPAGGTSTNVNITAPPSGSNTNTVLTISETLGEGLDLTGVSCSLATGTDFAIVGVIPATVASGSSLAVQVSFTDPGVAGPYTDTLTCDYTDSAGAATVTVNLTGSVQAVVVSTMSWLGYLAMMIGLLLVGSFGFRRQA
ncbi:MAG: choice-of-anchor D domain-containing protein [Proteobacteria bacterium]|nr:choice-of-anchor D domain-containing protein [Pseudomonadota bacterium]